MKKPLSNIIASLLCLALASSPVGSAGILLLGGSAGYTAQGVSFSATTTMERVAALSGVTDSKTIMLSFWFRAAAGTDSNTIRLFHSTNVGILLDRLGTSGLMRVICQNAASSNILFINTTATFLAGQGWKHILISGNLATATLQMYVEDVSDITITTNINDTIPWATGQSNYTIPDSGLPGPFDIADFWFDPNQTPLDLTVTANRRKFISAGLAPVDLGATGATPTGTSPAVFFSGVAASWNTNKGTGGGFTITAGSITSASSNPP